MYEYGALKPAEVISRREVGSWALGAHTCNPSYSGDKIRKIMVLSQPRKEKKSEALFQKHLIQKKRTV
jgi:hypothetical protein